MLLELYKSYSNQDVEGPTVHAGWHEYSRQMVFLPILPNSSVNCCSLKGGSWFFMFCPRRSCVFSNCVFGLYSIEKWLWPALKVCHQIHK